MVQNAVDAVHMKRALTLAALGKGNVAPNPMVGAVLVDSDNNVLGEGFHQAYGMAHAEVNALLNAREKTELDTFKGCTLYVTLEPCSHFGKTPPCVDAIISSGISRVVVAHMDPNPLVAGKGIERLRTLGLVVDVGVCEEEVKLLNAPFLKYITQRVPFVTLKTAMTLDGKISTVEGNSQWISGSQSRELTHSLRSEHRGIMVGIGTVLADNPLLTVRLATEHESLPPPRQPHRIVVDTHLRIPLNAKVIAPLANDQSITYIACGPQVDLNKQLALEALGCKILKLPLHKNQVDLRMLMTKLASEGIDSLLLEGGAELNFSALKSGIVDRILAFVAPKIVGGFQAKGPVGGQGIEKLEDAIQLQSIKAIHIGEDILLEAWLKESTCLQD